MPALEVLSVSVPGPPPQLRAAHVRVPAPGAGSDVFTLEVAGMVIARTGRAESVELICEGTLLRRMPVEFPRTGLTRSFPDLPDTLDCGFRGVVGTLLLPPEFELELVAVLDGERRASIGSIKGRRGRPQPSCQPRFRPLMLTSVGRTGTVWMMRMLTAHPSVVSRQNQPHEIWPARYWAHMLKVLSAPPDPLAPTAHTFDYDVRQVGPNPFYNLGVPAASELGEWLGRTHVDRLASFCIQNIEDWYAIAAREQGKEPIYFAEKNLLRTPLQGLGVADLYADTREVFLVRDFRDMACSWLSFRGHRWRETGFDAEHALAEMVEPWARLLVAGWRTRRERAYLVRYEDLVFRAHETLTDLCDHLGIDSSEGTVSQMLAAGADNRTLPSHETSPTLEQTVGRWSREGDDSLGDTLNQIFHEALVEFGYVEAAARPA